MVLDTHEGKILHDVREEEEGVAGDEILVMDEGEDANHAEDELHSWAVEWTPLGNAPLVVNRWQCLSASEVHL